MMNVPSWFPLIPRAVKPARPGDEAQARAAG